MAKSSKAGEHQTRAEWERDDRRADIAHVLALSATKNAPKPTKGTLLDSVRASKEQDEHFNKSESLIDEPLEEYEAGLAQLQQAVQARLGIGGGYRSATYLAKLLAGEARTPNELEAAVVLFPHRHGPLLDEFMREYYVPNFNRVCGKWVRRCPECFRVFKPNGSRDRFCNETCAARARNRGRERVGSGKSAVEAALARLHQRAKRHAARCPHCKRGAFCQTSTEIWNAITAADALNNAVPSADPEVAADHEAARAWEIEEEEDPVRRLRIKAK